MTETHSLPAALVRKAIGAAMLAAPSEAQKYLQEIATVQAWIQEPGVFALHACLAAIEEGAPLDPVAIATVVVARQMPIPPSIGKQLIAFFVDLHIEAPAAIHLPWFADAVRDFRLATDIEFAADRIKAAARGTDPDLRRLVIEKTIEELMAALDQAA